MSAFFRHDATGRILATGQCPDGSEPFYEHEGQTLVAGMDADGYRHWYDVASQALREREAPDIQVSGTQVTGIPTPCELRITGPVALNATLDAPVLDLEFDLPGTYCLEFEPMHPRWLPKSFEVTV
jgi:hypothetical protein